MDSNFGNYPREKFDPFSVMLFKALQVVAFLFFIALLAMNPEAKQGKIESKAEFIITMTWPDNHPDDIDLYVEDPLGNIVWYHVREAGFMVLDRDDRGGANNSITVERQEDHQPDPPGDHQHPRHRRRRIHGERPPFSRHNGGPVPVIGQGREGQSDRRGGVLRKHHRSTRMGEEKTAVRFRLGRRRQRRRHQPSAEIADPADAQRAAPDRAADDHDPARHFCRLCRHGRLLLLSAGLTARFAWWVKASAIVVTSVFFVEVFFASKGLLGWPGTGALPAKFQLLWTRVVEPDPKLSNRGAIYLWVEEVDENNVPSGVPRAYRLPYSHQARRPLAQGARRDHGGQPAGGHGGGFVRRRSHVVAKRGRLQPAE